jgi:dipeptidyl aminopeptidase/acylaminoacyl peptidase
LTEIKRCGSWESPLGSADLVRGALRLSAPKIDGGRIFWLEGRPNEGGRQVVMCVQLSDTGVDGTSSFAEAVAREVTPPAVNVRTRVHEYGGGEYAVWRDRIFFVDDADGRIFMGDVGGTAIPVTPLGSQHADLAVSPDGRWLFAVEERPRESDEPENRLIAIPLGPGSSSAGAEAVPPPHIVASGHDFYASPTIAPSSDQVAFLSWDHPNMPWNGTFLESIAWGEQGALGPVQRRAGSVTESLFQPRFSGEGVLFAVSDCSGWWNLIRIGDGEPVPVHSLRAELGRPQWVFGQSSWSFVAPEMALASATFDGSDVLVRIDLESGDCEKLVTGFQSIGGIQSEEGWSTCIAGSAAEASALFVWRSTSDRPECLRKSAPFEIPDDSISRAVSREFASADGRTTHAFVYSPRSAKQGVRPGEIPPLLIKSHGGPTSATSSALDPRIQFWTSRGFAVADVNYGGSTGYGRAYRDQLRSQWGVVDVEDCVAVASALAEEGLADGARLAISGGSAGGYTTLCALTFHETFAAGASHYGIGDLEALARDTHKFESRYTDWLVGPLPDARDRYIERSPVHHPEGLGCPMIFFQGLEDKVVPPNQAEAMVEVLARRGIAHAYVPFEEEQHGFRRAENIRTALDGELYFYSRVFGFDAPQPEGVNVVPARAR